MKIQEIIQEYGETDIRIRRRPQSFDYSTLRRAQNRNDPNYDPDWDDAGDSEVPSKVKDADQNQGDVQPGWYSGGQTNPRDPHEFVKRPHLTALLDRDAYYRYVKEINDLKKQGYSNPFFPQVYNVDIVQDKKGNQRPRYRIEKLQQGEDLSFEALEGLYERLFYNTVDSKRYQQVNRPEWSIWFDICKECSRAVESSNYSNIRDDQLLEALTLIDRIIKENPDWNVDLHSNNIRIRGSGTGPQLVLMDPISDGGASIPDKDDILYGPKLRSRRPGAR